MAAHPGADPVDPAAAQGHVAGQLGAAAPAPGVSGEQLGAQMHAAGATAGLPADQAHDDEMARLKAAFEDLSQQVVLLQQERARERQAAITALGEPILSRYARAIRDKLTAHQHAHPGLGEPHFGKVIDVAGQLYKATDEAISQGANDLGRVRYLADVVDRWLTRGHRRTAPAHLAHGVDLSAVEQDLEYLITEAERLAPAGQAVVRA